MTRILVVDDEPDLVRFVRRALEAEGYQVLVATEGADGLRLALTECPDLIVLDLLMPGVDGHAVLPAYSPSIRSRVSWCSRRPPMSRHGSTAWNEVRSTSWRNRSPSAS